MARGLRRSLMGLQVGGRGWKMQVHVHAFVLWKTVFDLLQCAAELFCNFNCKIWVFSLS